MPWTRKDLLGLEPLSAEELRLVLDQVKAFKEVSTRSVKKVPALRGRTVVLCFLEPSTRTRASFELAAKRLSADILQVQPASSSLLKGESVVDTARNIEAMQVDAVVLRHNSSGIPVRVAQAIRPSVINAGDGSHEHPTQGLVDLFTILEKKGRIEGLNVLIVGDVLHSRVARSDFWGLSKLGAKVTFCGPPPLVPAAFEGFGARIATRLEDVLPEADVVIALRIQKERMEEQMIPSFRSYARLYGIDEAKLARAKPDVLIMHPGPVNRGVELAPEVADGPRSVILDQVTNGIAVRMAALFLTISAQEPAASSKPAAQTAAVSL
ncbi:MAG: aspartate carbamoyltransferase [Candidatus Omnitrophica bacterium CG11_big_fil_rev_8_21_14_0_20_64_10]|nr:MAG: aspartate carbamoyltransferase [Candidatus Omnitrophica bacterium CG11_big_fil_rev_8_21_14_0_20_64_10]